MNWTSLVVVGIVVGLFTLSVVAVRADKTNQCSGHCIGCAVQCDCKQQSKNGLL